MTVKLQPPDEKGGWLDEFNKNAIYFELDDEGKVQSMTIDSRSRLGSEGWPQCIWRETSGINAKLR